MMLRLQLPTVCPLSPVLEAYSDYLVSSSNQLQTLSLQSRFLRAGRQVGGKKQIRQDPVKATGWILLIIPSRP
jgi:hypothetical protein